jgi:molybdenum cofactor biosynthesis protein B
MTTPYEEHQQSAGQITARCAVITLSDTRTEATDKSGARIRELLASAGHAVVFSRVIKDDPQILAALLDELLKDQTVDLVMTNGGTGISRRDCTISVVEKFLTQPLPGFGELFRMLSFQQIGSGWVFCMPGSTRAVELAMEKLILPEIRHLLGELRK